MKAGVCGGGADALSPAVIPSSRLERYVEVEWEHGLVESGLGSRPLSRAAATTTPPHQSPSSTGRAKAAGPPQPSCRQIRTAIRPRHPQEATAQVDRSNGPQCRTGIRIRRPGCFHPDEQRIPRRTNNSPRGLCSPRVPPPPSFPGAGSCRSDPHASHSWRARAYPKAALTS